MTTSRPNGSDLPEDPFEKYAKDYLKKHRYRPAFEDYIKMHIKEYEDTYLERDLAQLEHQKQEIAIYTAVIFKNKQEQASILKDQPQDSTFITELKQKARDYLELPKQDESFIEYADFNALTRSKAELQNRTDFFFAEKKRLKQEKQEERDKESKGYAFRFIPDKTDFPKKIEAGILYVKKFLLFTTDLFGNKKPDFLLQYRVIDPNGGERVGFIKASHFEDNFLDPDRADELYQALNTEDVSSDKIREFLPDILVITTKKGHTASTLDDLQSALGKAKIAAMVVKTLPLLVAFSNISTEIMKVFKGIGLLCPPVIQSINAATGFLMLLGEILRLKDNKTLSQFAGTIGRYEIRLITFRLLSLSCYAAAAVAYSGFVFGTAGIGPALVAAAALVDWIGGYLSTKAQLKMLEKRRDQSTDTIERAAFDLEIEDAKKKSELINKNWFWEMANVGSLALFAGGAAFAAVPVLGEALLAVGIVVLIGVVLRNFYVGRQDAKKAKAEAAANQLEPEPALEDEKNQRWTVRLKNWFAQKIDRVLDGLEYVLGGVASLYSWISGSSHKTATSNPATMQPQALDPQHPIGSHSKSLRQFITPNGQNNNQPVSIPQASSTKEKTATHLFGARPVMPKSAHATKTLHPTAAHKTKTGRTS